MNLTHMSIAQLCLLCSLASGLRAGAQVFIGERTYTVSEQRANPTVVNDQFYPSIAVLSDGRLIVSWTSQQNGPTDCYARAFLADGTPDSSEFLLNPCLTSRWQYGTAPTALPNGGFAAAWGHESASEYLQFFSSSLTLDRCQILVHNSPPGSWPDADSSASGDVVVAWGRQSMGIGARWFNADGTPYGPGFLVNTIPLNFPDNSIASLTTVASAPDGRCCFVWYDHTGNIQARLYDQAGVPLTSQFTVNSSTGGARAKPTVAHGIPDRWYITWHGSGALDPDGVYMRTFDSSGVPIGDEDEILVNQTTVGQQSSAIVASSSSGEVVVTWTSVDVSGNGVWGRLYDAAGGSIGDEFQVNQYTSGSQSTHYEGGRKLVKFVGSRIAFAWSGGSPGDSVGIGLTVFTLACPEDVNGDGVTSVLDLIELLACFGLPATPPCDTGQDVNGDGTVNVLDLITLLLAFGTVCP